MMSGASNQAAAGPQGMSSLLQAYVCLFVATGIEKDFFGSLTAFWYMERLWLNPFNVDPEKTRVWKTGKSFHSRLSQIIL